MILEVYPTNSCPLHRGTGDSICKFQKGFSLLEILVVLLLIALTTSLVAITIRHDISTVVEGEARRFAALVEQMCQESITQGKMFALSEDGATGYRFDVFAVDHWQPVVNDDVFRPRMLPEGITIALELPGSGNNKSKGRLLCGPDGVLTPFSALFAIDETQYRVSTNELQAIQIKVLDPD